MTSQTPIPWQAMLLSEDVRFPKLNAEETSAALEYRSTQSMEALTAVLKMQISRFPGKKPGRNPSAMKNRAGFYFSLPIPMLWETM